MRNSSNASSRAAMLLAVIGLAGCSLNSSLGGSLGGGNSPPTQAVAEQSHAFDGMLVRAQLEKVRGMTIAQAKAYLKSLGHDGEVAIFEQPTFSNRCAAQTVCDVEPESGTGMHDRVTLVINPNSHVDISLPP